MAKALDFGAIPSDSAVPAEFETVTRGLETERDSCEADGGVFESDYGSRKAANKIVGFTKSEPDYPLSYLSICTSRPNSSRPLNHQVLQITIRELGELGLLEFRCTRHFRVTEGYDWWVFQSDGKKKLKVQLGKIANIFELESRPWGDRVTWYFRIPETGGLTRALYFSGTSFGDRKQAGAVYPSQYQSETLKKFVRLAKLILALDGDPHIPRGAARGTSRLKKIAELRRMLDVLKLPSREKEKVLQQFPQFIETVRRAKRLLKIELARLPADVPPT